MDTIRAVSKRVGRHEPRVLVLVCVLSDCVNGTVPHAMPENMRCLAILTGKRAATADLYIPLPLEKCRICIEPDAGIRRFIIVSCRHAGYFPVFALLYPGKKAGECEFPLTGNHIIGIFCCLTRECRRMRTIVLYLRNSLATWHDSCLCKNYAMMAK